MKKIVVLICVAVISQTAMAQKIAYILPDGCNKDLTGFPVENNAVGGDHTQEKNAAVWFKAQYVDLNKGAFLTIDEVAAGELANYSCAWIHLERFNSAFSSAADLRFSDIKVALRNYVMNGGNLMLSKQATWIAYDMGRIGYAPSVTSEVTYEEKGADDFWGTLANYPTGHVDGYNWNSHPLFNGMSFYDDNNDFWHGSVKLLNSRFRQTFDKSYSWNDYSWRNEEGGFTNDGITGNNKARIDGFQDATIGWNCHVLAQRRDIGDYCLSEIIEFLPYAEAAKTSPFYTSTLWKGTILSMGANFYQWEESSNNTEIAKITRNAFDYLVAKGKIAENINTTALISENQYVSTFFSANATAVPAGLKAFTAQVDGENMTLVEVPNGYIPAETGVLLLGENTDAHDFYYYTGDTQNIIDNAFIGTTVATTGTTLKEANTGKNLYVLSKKDSSVGFYALGNTTNVSAGKAVLAVDASTQAKSFIIDFDSNKITAIRDIKNTESKTDVAYNLKGQRVQANVKGIIIIDGEKYINK